VQLFRDVLQNCEYCFSLRYFFNFSE